MQDSVTITVDGTEMRVQKGSLLWEACNAHGIEIPIFCYHSKLGPVGACRTCMVELEGAPKPITACSTPVTDGMKVRTRSPVVEKAQRGIFEFLLANHPLDCPICDRGGECPLQDQTFAFGPGVSRYVEPKRHHVKPIVLGPTIALDRERCVLCWRCVRFCDEVAEDKSIVLLDRGDHTVVGTFHDEPYVSNFSGNVVELCPVGALTSRKQRFNFRPWELQTRPSVCPHCPMGCNINISVRKNDEVIRFLSRDNPEVDNSWLCDRGRYGFEFIDSPERIHSPLIRRGDSFEQVSWTEALEFIAGSLRDIVEVEGSGAVAGIASPRLTNEDLYVFRRFFRDVIGTEAIDHFPRPSFGGSVAAPAALEHLRGHATAISDLLRADTIALLFADPSARAPVLELRIREAVNKHGARLIVLGPDDIPLTGKAHRRITREATELAELARALAKAVSGGDGEQSSELAEAVALLTQGRTVLVYDDSFAGVADKIAALSAVADLVETLAERGEIGVLPLLDDCNSMGARDLEIYPAGDAFAPHLSDTLPARAAFILGANVARDGPGARDRLSSLDLLVVHELFMTETANLAHVVLPACSFAEKSGSFTNLEGRVQTLSPAVPGSGIARADWEILVDLSQYFETPLDYSRVEDIWDHLQRDVPAYSGLRFEDIGPRGTRSRALQPV